MAAPSLALAGQKSAAKDGFEQAAADFGLCVVRGVVQHHVADGFRFVDDEHPAPQNALHNNVGVEILRRVSGRCIIAHGA